MYQILKGTYDKENQKFIPDYSAEVLAETKEEAVLKFFGFKSKENVDSSYFNSFDSFISTKDNPKSIVEYDGSGMKKTGYCYQLRIKEDWQ